MYWQGATFTFQVNGLQHSFVFAPSYAELEVDFQLRPTLTVAEVAHNLMYQLQRWGAVNNVTHITVKRMFITL